MDNKSALYVWNTIVNFYQESPKNFARVANVPLIPENDPTLLFVNSGMFPLVPYLSGEKHPLGKRLFNTQRSIRTGIKDIAEIGDSYHTTCFSMFGDWSLGDFFKAEQIPWIAELYLDRFGFNIDKFYVSVFKGDDDAPRDDEAIELWLQEFKKRGVENPLITDDPTKINDNYDANGNILDGQDHYKIFLYGKDECWWQRGEAAGELGGPCSEMFFDIGKVDPMAKELNIPFHDQGDRFVELGNNVFMEYYLDDNLNWKKLAQKNVDFGGGYERVVFALQGKQDIFDTELFLPIIDKISEYTGREYHDLTEEDKAPYRIIADHVRAATFIISDGVLPSNKEQGYILRSFIRRAINQAEKLNLPQNTLSELSLIVADVLSMLDDYKFLLEKKSLVADELNKEEEKFRKTLVQGKRELEKLLDKNNNQFSGSDAFYLYESFGLPIDLQIDELESKNIDFDIVKLNKNFLNAKKEHQEKSRAGAEKVFKGGLADTSHITTAYHTTTHLLLVALNNVLNPEVEIVQKGSNITSDRLRFDFNYAESISDEQIVHLENYINSQISQNLTVNFEEMPKEDAVEMGVKGQFDDKYGDIVKVYTLKNEKTGDVVSQEFCGGPHVSNTSEIAALGEFKIAKIENIGSGIKRVRGSFSK